MRLDEAQLTAYLDGELAQAEREWVEKQLAASPKLQAVVARLRREIGQVDRALDLLAPWPADQAPARSTMKQPQAHAHPSSSPGLMVWESSPLLSEVKIALKNFGFGRKFLIPASLVAAAIALVVVIGIGSAARWPVIPAQPATPLPPTGMPVSVPPTDRPTPVPPTATPTRVPPTATRTPAPPTATPTPLPPTNTPTPTSTRKPTPTPESPSATPGPAAELKIQFQPKGAFGRQNMGLTRFMGTITDRSGNPVNGFSLYFTCENFHVMSYPSGPSSVAPNSPLGWYDQYIASKELECDWSMQVVIYQCENWFDPQCTQFAALAPPDYFHTKPGQTVVTADWWCNFDCDKGVKR